MSDWIEWNGGLSGERPTEGYVEARMRNGTIIHPARAESLDWSHFNMWNDIIAYRIHKETA